MKKENIKPGQIATFVYEAPHKMNKRNNPLFGLVTKHSHIVGNVAGKDGYENRLAKSGETPKGKSTWFKGTDIEGVVAHKTSGKEYVAVLPASVKSNPNYTIDGRPVTKDEMEIIKSFTPKKPKGVIITIAIDHLKNLK